MPTRSENFRTIAGAHSVQETKAGTGGTPGHQEAHQRPKNLCLVSLLQLTSPRRRKLQVSPMQNGARGAGGQLDRVPTPHDRPPPRWGGRGLIFTPKKSPPTPKKSFLSSYSLHRGYTETNFLECWALLISFGRPDRLDLLDSA
jgi:hypothetical protein